MHQLFIVFLWSRKFLFGSVFYREFPWVRCWSSWLGAHTFPQRAWTISKSQRPFASGPHSSFHQPPPRSIVPFFLSLFPPRSSKKSFSSSFWSKGDRPFVGPVWLLFQWCSWKRRTSSRGSKARLDCRSSCRRATSSGLGRTSPGLRIPAFRQTRTEFGICFRIGLSNSENSFFASHFASPAERCRP